MRIGTSNRSEQVPIKPENIDVLKRASVDFGVAVTSMAAVVEAMVDDFDKLVGELRGDWV
jgi:hypothetical protein